jgi:DNA-binding PadR family transcriptional regulator
MYQLFILGQLMDKPMSGYQLRKALTTIVGPEKTISFGSLYPLLDKLATAGDLTISLKKSEHQRPQKIAALTDAGRAHFWELISAPVVSNKQTQTEFLMKVQFLHLLSVDQQLTVLNDFKTYLNQRLERLHQKQIELPQIATMATEDVADSLWVIDLHIVSTEAQIKSLKKMIKTIKKEL